jgi:hypothetical protein
MLALIPKPKYQVVLIITRYLGFGIKTNRIFSFKMLNKSSEGTLNNPTNMLENLFFWSDMTFY